jgi:AcrR family transcriptional regulator
MVLVPSGMTGSFCYTLRAVDTTMKNPFEGATALIVAHPGHELRVHGWMERTRPEVFVLTDGSGHTERSRLASTAEVLRRAGARPGTVFGRFRDRSLYELLLSRDLDTLEHLVRDLAEALVQAEIHCVAADAVEGYNPGHDLCRVVADAAVSLAQSCLGRPIASYDFPLDGRPDSGHSQVRLELDDEALRRKMEASLAYPEMRAEVERNLAEHGREAFRVECLRLVDREAVPEHLVEDPPYYERYGERQVAAGHYDRVLRFREHFLPVARALRELGRSAFVLAGSGSLAETVLEPGHRT